MTPHAWKCVACSRSYRAKSEPSRAPRCPTCGVTLVPSSRNAPAPRPRSLSSRGGGRPASGRMSSRPAGPQEALALVSSSSAWMPDPEPPPSPDFSGMGSALAGDLGASGDEAPTVVEVESGQAWIVASCAAGVAVLALIVTAVVLLTRPATPRVVVARPAAGQTGTAQAKVIPAVSVIAPVAGPRVVNLLKLIDPQRDTFTGNWRLHREGSTPLLSSDGTQHARLNIPYAPPEEYDFRVEFTRTGGDNCMSQMFTHKNPCALILFGWKGKVSGFQLVKNQFADRNLTSVHDLVTENGQLHTSEVRVRRHYIEAWLDGAMIIHYDTDGADLGSKDWTIDTPLGVGSQMSPTTFEAIELTEISGVGHSLR